MGLYHFAHIQSGLTCLNSIRTFIMNFFYHFHWYNPSFWLRVTLTDAFYWVKYQQEPWKFSWLERLSIPMHKCAICTCKMYAKSMKRCICMYIQVHICTLLASMNPAFDSGVSEPNDPFTVLTCWIQQLHSAVCTAEHCHNVAFQKCIP